MPRAVVPVELDVGLVALFNPAGHMEYRFDRTLLSRVMSPAQAEAWLGPGFGSIRGIVAQFVVDFTFQLLVVLGVVKVVPASVFLVGVVATSLFNSLGLFTSDLGIARFLVSRFQVIIQLVACLIASVSMSALMGFDYRTAFVIPNVLATIVVSNTTAQPRFVRRVIMAGSLCYYTPLATSYMVLLNLGRIPDVQNIFVSFGTLGGIASDDQVYSVKQFCSSAWFVVAVLNWRYLLHGIVPRVGSVAVPIELVDEDGLEAGLSVKGGLVLPAKYKKTTAVVASENN